MDTVRLETRYGMADGLTPVLAAPHCRVRFEVPLACVHRERRADDPH